ncbi:hypothetical protein IKD98_00130 [Candidatus Saccharibacteria bacterium]|nr:hypothetical protein [Candidatus Saccharibacteria bacterium]
MEENNWNSSYSSTASGIAPQTAATDSIIESTKPRNIIAIVFIIMLTPIIIAIIATTFAIINHISVEDAMSSDVDAALYDAVTMRTQSSDLSVHLIGSQSNWYVATLISLSPDSYGSSTTAILVKNNGAYEIKYIGTDLNKNTLREKGIPDNIINMALSTDKASTYSSILTKSRYNPINKYPLLQHLPIQTDALKISYDFDELKDPEGTYLPIITIKGQDAAERKNALRKIKTLGFDPGSYRIRFANFNSQFDKNRPLVINYVEGEQAP